MEVSVYISPSYGLMLTGSNSY